MVEHRDLSVGHDHEHYLSEDSEGVQAGSTYDGDYAILSKARASHLENDLKGSTRKRRKRFHDEARKDVDEKDGLGSLLEKE